jgi:hypothetical protein
MRFSPAAISSLTERQSTVGSQSRSMDLALEKTVTSRPISGTVEGEGLAAMTVTINLPPEKEAALKARARAQGLSVEEWLLQLAEHAAAEPTPAQKRFDQLSELLLNCAGANLSLERYEEVCRELEVKRRTSQARFAPRDYITQDEADVLLSKRRERDEQLIPWEQVEAELAELD